jgi:hypothetical protein
MATGSVVAAQEVTVGAGWSGDLDGGDSALAAGLDVTFGDLARVWRLRAGLGAALATTGDADLWGGAGPVVWLDLRSGWRLEGSAMVGLYADRQVDLGGPVQFHSRIGVSYALAPSWRLGASFGHISNAGLYDENPGLERAMVTLSYSL